MPLSALVQVDKDLENRLHVNIDNLLVDDLCQGIGALLLFEDLSARCTVASGRGGRKGASRRVQLQWQLNF